MPKKKFNSGGEDFAGKFERSAADAGQIFVSGFSRECTLNCRCGAAGL
jgi:hypothetical protein